MNMCNQNTGYRTMTRLIKSRSFFFPLLLSDRAESQRRFVFCRCHSEHLLLLLQPLIVYRAEDGGWLPDGPHSSLRQKATSEKWRNRILDVNLIESGSRRRRSPLLLLTCSTSSRPGGEAGGWASPRPPPWKQIRSVWAGACLHKPCSSSGNRLNNDLVKNNN